MQAFYSVKQLHPPRPNLFIVLFFYLQHTLDLQAGHHFELCLCAFLNCLTPMLRCLQNRAKWDGVKLFPCYIRDL